MVWMVYLCFLAPRIYFAYPATCGYNLGDPKGVGFHKLLATQRIKTTIHGEFSHTRPRDEEIDTQVCKSIWAHYVKPPHIWFSSLSDTDPTPSPRLFKHECRKHRMDFEDANAFMQRVLRTCRIIKGFLVTIYCRFHSEEGHRFNVAQQIVLSDQMPDDIYYRGCKFNYLIKTPDGWEIIKQNTQTYFMNVETQIFLPEGQAADESGARASPVVEAPNEKAFEQPYTRPTFVYLA
ncbi:hypothetical protein RF11_08077 [Thelohanellus kitauei]|uniref:SnoaL-like domain-containing protein n=1 Tax=Thelohanellus kitauei TaxID=669202 RepID=A0A0C2NEN3_THEKT|nr:hypothetical protein RF11_08077 [Thelohanellus kitauei]